MGRERLYDQGTRTLATIYHLSCMDVGNMKLEKYDFIKNISIRTTPAEMLIWMKEISKYTSIDEEL